VEFLQLTIQVLLLVLLSAICSGLNIALMSLDVADLSRKAKIGNKDAARVLPLRQNSHLALAAILLSNVAAVSATALVLESVAGGLIAGLATTLLLVIFGEIMPQALFSKQALHYTALLSPVLRLMIVVTYPFSKPLQLLLDKLFGAERTELHSRHELGLIITEHLGDDNSELDDDEIEIIRGALQLSEKQVHTIMTPIRSVYWVAPQDTIDAHKIDEIKSRGWSRVPVFNKQLTSCHGLLIMKNLVDIDFNGHSHTVRDLPLHPTQLVGSKTALDTLFRKFIVSGVHLFPVEKDDRIVGIVTIEDLLEEIVGHEIEDETDRKRHDKSRLKKRR
jgi:CBS domain containing-hemolysin-like protein